MSTGSDYGVAGARAVSVAWSRSLSSFYPTNCAERVQARLNLLDGRLGSDYSALLGHPARRRDPAARGGLLQRAVLRLRGRVPGSTTSAATAAIVVPEGPPVQPRLHAGRHRHLLELLRQLRRLPSSRLDGRPPLVTGAAGFVGQHLLTARAPIGPVVGWYRPGTAHPAVHGVTWASVELLDRAAVTAALAAARPSAIYHLAGVAHVGDSWAQAEETFAGNVVGTSHLFDGLRAVDAGRVLVTGSATIYRPSTEAARPKTRRSRRTRPTARASWRRRWWRWPPGRARPRRVVTRSFNHIGPLQSPAFAASGFARAARLHRSRSGAAGDLGRQPRRRGATSATCATRCAPTSR